MEKIGIMTWFFVANYGAKAQAYAMQQIIKNLGYDVCLINYLPRHSGLKEFWTEHNKPISTLERIHSLKKMERRIKKSKKVRNATDITSLGFDAIIFGSDAIFNVKHILFNPVYYGVGIKGKKIAFSPSCEYLPPDYNLDREIQNSLKEFNAISVRDNNTAQLIKNNIGKKPIITLDPTFLYEYDEMIDFPIKEKYILIYAFSEWNEYSDEIKHYAHEIQAKIVSVGQQCKWADIDFRACSLERWISAFKRASIVFTDSFHGTVFAIKNQKELILCSRSDKSSKIDDLLNELGISKPYYSGERLEDYLKQTINYSYVNERLRALKKYSIEYIAHNLQD